MKQKHSNTATIIIAAANADTYLYLLLKTNLYTVYNQ